MEITIPTVLKALSAGGSAMKSINSWWNKSTGDSRAIIGELKDNLLYLEMVAVDNVPLGDVADKLSVIEYKRLSKEGFNFNKLKRTKILKYPSLKGSDLEKWGGKETEELVVSIYDKVNEIKIRFPHVGDNKKYRWGVRVINIRKRIWLLLKHVSS
ncbi:hypothetical protein TUM17387_12770 [Shewanella carassii]|uniref:hypothetical protein n=1 Tax=Shewanella carassii TaxID=1987584 RepID=UPI001BF01B88|nr:hypothetical protein [Shewanella carassii]BCV65918.1 hypothetical protein TUM17387_12770 [Shewanella carassii]